MQLTRGFSKYLLNTSWLVGEKIVNMLTTFVVGVYVARYLGPEKLGLLSYSNSLVMVFIPIFKLGLDAIVVRELVKDERRRDVLLGTSLGLKLLGVFIVWILLGLTITFTNDDFSTNILIAIIASSLLFQSFEVIDFYFQAKVMSKYTAIARILARSTISGINIILVLLRAQLMWFAFVILLQHLVICGFFMVFYRMQNLSILEWRFDWGTAKQLLKDSWPLCFAGLMIVVYMKIDQVMLKNMCDATQVGIYSVAVTISEVWYFIPVLISQSLFPAVINAKRSGTLLYRQRMQSLYDLMTLSSLCIAIFITLSSSLIINVLFGKAYAGAADVLKIHIWAGVSVFFGTARGKWIIAENLQRKAIVVHITGATLNVILNLIFIPRYGAVGAALATLSSYVSNNIITSIAIREFRGQFLMYLKSFLNCLTLKVVRQVLLERHAF